MNGGCMHLDRIHDATPLVLGLRGLPERHASTLDRVVTAMAESFGGDPVGVAVFDNKLVGLAPRPRGRERARGAGIYAGDKWQPDARHTHRALSVG